MPSLFFSGKTEFSVSGSADQIKALKKAVKNNEHGIKFEFVEFEDIPCIFYLYPFHVIKGSLTVDPVGDSFRITFDGVAKIPLDKSAFEYLTKKESTLDISGVTCHPFSVYVDGRQGNLIPSTLKISKTAPK